MEIAVALREIRRYQRDFTLLLPKLPFQRVVKEVMNDMAPGKQFRIQRSALEALQEAAEAAIVTEFESKYSYIIVIFILI